MVQPISNSRFFTNQDGNTLLEKFAGCFSNTAIAQFDVLVGYFYASGYFKLRPHLDDVEQIRILVGIDVDQLIKKYAQKGLQLTTNPEEAKQWYCKTLEQEINDADYLQDIEESMLAFVKDIVSGKVQIRAHPSRKLHAKIYILRPEPFNEHSGGNVITGSSNLTAAGLGASSDSNYEFNVLLRDYADIKFASDEFENLWQEGIALEPTEIEKVKNDTFLKDNFTPFELYIKLLIEYFGKEIEFDPNNIKDLPKDFKRLEYQLDAVYQGFQMLDKHNGFFLADVVGLGKTIVAILIARYYFFKNGFPDYRSRTLIVVPPVLKDNWSDSVEKFHLDNVDYITTGSLSRINSPKNYDLIIVDESHKFRNTTSQAYDELQRICKAPTRQNKAKKVILISATPLNNRPDDLFNQIRLFQDNYNSSLVANLGKYAAQCTKTYKHLIKNTLTTDTEAELAALYTDIRNKIIVPVTVRRTRQDLTGIQRYKKDLAKNNIVFPKVQKPKILLYQLEAKLNQLYDDTLKRITEKTGLQYMRYRVIEFLKPEHKKTYSRADSIAKQLTAIMRTLLIKRMDSSFYALHQTLGRFVKASAILLGMFAKNCIIIAPNHKVTEAILDGKEEQLIDKLLIEQLTDPSIKTLEAQDFEPDFISKLKQDHGILQELEQQWQQVINSHTDPKLDKLIDILDPELFNKTNNPTQKLIIFSESVDTIEHLRQRLTTEKPDHNVLDIDSRNYKKRKQDIKNNFDANTAPSEQRSDYDIMIATEVLAEGINLHRANTIVNYDTPWNATRLMQRIGRINRIGTSSTEIHIFNFLPTEKVEGDIHLRQRASVKLQAFHTALGEDSQIYTPDEKVYSFGLFDKNVQEEEDVNRHLIYLEEIRKFRENSPDEFKRIKELPQKIRNGRQLPDPDWHYNTLVFLQNKLRQQKLFCRIDAEDEIKEISFLDAVKIFQCDPGSSFVALHDQHHKQVDLAVQHFEKHLQVEAAENEVRSTSLSPRDTQVIHFLQAWVNNSITSQEEQKQIRQAIELINLGRYQMLGRSINKLKNNIRKTPVNPGVALANLLDIIQRYQTSQPEPSPAVAAPPGSNPSLFKPAVIISQSYI